MPSSKSYRFLAIVPVVIILLIATFFFINLRSQINFATQSFEVENQINQLNQLYTVYLDAVSQKRDFQLNGNSENRLAFETLDDSLEVLITEFRKLPVKDKSLEPKLSLFLRDLQVRREKLHQHVKYFDLMPEDSARSLVLEDLENTQAISGKVEEDFQDLMGALLPVSSSLKNAYFSKARTNYFGFLGLFFLSFLLILINYQLGKRQQGAESEKEHQKRLLELAEKENYEFKTTFDNAAIGMGLASESGKWLRVNASLCRMLGYTPEELMQLTFQEITHPDDLFADLEQAKRLVKKEIESYTMEKRYFTKNGEAIWINLNGSAVWNEDGSLRYFIAQVENINPRKVAFQALSEQKSRFENVIAGTNSGTWEWNVQTGKTVFNKTWAEIVGYQLEELEPTTIETWGRFVHPDDLEKSNLALQKCFSGEVPYYQAECRMRHRDGHWVWILDRGKVMTWTEDGKPELMFGTHLDITKFKNLEAELLQKEAFLQAMLDTIDVGIVVCDKQGELTLFNKAALDFHGVNSLDIPSSEWAEYYQLLHQDEVTPLLREEIPLYRAWKGEQVLSESFCIRHKSGRLFHINSSGSQILDEQGNLLGAVVAMKDITQAKKLADELERSERKFKGIFNSTFQFIGFLNPDGTVVEANQTALEFGGLTPSDVIGKKFWDCHWWQISAETQERLKASIDLANQGQFVQYEVEVWDKDKQPVVILFNLKPLLDQSGNVIAIIPEGRLIQDIIDARKSLEDKNHELERFASVASHDLKEPLRMVINFLQLLEKKYKGNLDEKADQYIHFTVDASQRMNRLVNDLLEYSRVGTREAIFEPIDLNLLMKDQEKYLSGLLEECGGAISYSLLPTIVGKEVPIQTLFRNLLGNAIKYRKEEVSLKISVAAKEFSDHWEFSISDNGIGFDPAQAERIFDIFTRLHTTQHYSGTGLGLAICKKIVEQHYSKIWANSVPGEGSTFYFTITKLSHS